MSKFLSEREKGYTLIEILVTLVIIGILFGVGFLNFREFSRKQSLVSLSRKVKGDLALARESAVSGKKPSDPSCTSPNSLTGYNFRVTDSLNYVLEAVCSGGTVEVKSVDLSEELTIEEPSPNPIFFKVLSKGTNLSSEATITLNQLNTNYSLNIYVTQTGEIR